MSFKDETAFHEKFFRSHGHMGASAGSMSKRKKVEEEQKNKWCCISVLIGFRSPYVFIYPTLLKYATETASKTVLVSLIYRKKVSYSNFPDI